MINAVIFDMDGLMFDTERIYADAWDYAGQKCGYGKTGYMALKTLGMNYEKTKQVWHDEFGEGLKEEMLIKHFQEYIQNFTSENKVPVKKGLYELITFLEETNIKIAVASSSPLNSIQFVLRDAGLTERISVIASGDMVEHSKPDPEIYLKACQLAGEKPEDCLALEDSKSGLLSAYHAGLRPVMIPDLWQPDEEIEKILFAKLSDLTEVINLVKDDMIRLKRVHNMSKLTKSKTCEV